MNFYRIRKVGTDEFLKTARGKTIWTGSGPAKNAYNNHVGAYRHNSRPQFDEQTEWELVEVVMVPKGEFSEMKRKARSLDGLQRCGVC